MRNFPGEGGAKHHIVKFFGIGAWIMQSEILTIGMEHKKFAFDREMPPVARIQSGDSVIFQTEDANCSLITKESDLWAEFPKLYEKGGGCNPVTGPVYVEGAKPGDCLSVKIKRVVPGFIRNGGYTSMYSGLGALQNCQSSVQKPLEPRTKICGFEDGEILFKLHDCDEHLRLPMRPFVGTIGVAPKEDRRSSFYQGKEWCGNVDIADIAEGATVVLPVHVPGALFAIGDIHALQGDGEITGCALECQGEVEVQIDVLSREEAFYVDWPQVNTDAWIGAIACLGYRNLSEAVNTGYTELIRRMKLEYGIEELDGYQLLNLMGEVRVGNSSSCVCKISRAALKRYANR